MSKLDYFRPRLHTILVVDDEKDICDSLKALLESHFPGSKVATALDGEQGLATLKGGGVDVIIADYKMPGMDGLEFLAEARRLKPHIPRVLITAYPELQAAVRAINEAQISNFLTKPLNTTQLLDVVRAALVKARVKAAA